ncbi:MAG: methyltransferase domain-containing protein [Cutibacterium sp.]|nr:methyltransferase domain-containing protein [Roseomonas sp.]MCA3775591.1 methyltransferase domain-containing protein [Cutibacterium sp.]
MTKASSDLTNMLTVFEAAFASRYPKGAEGLSHEAFIERYAAEMLAAVQVPAIGAWYDENHSISMCPRDTLVALTVLASLATGPIVEFGPYVGGTTVALSRGAKVVCGQVITIEKGGAHDHPNLPSNDILADLHRNLERFGVAEVCNVLEGHYKLIVEALAEKLGGRKVALVFCDADGEFDQAFAVVRPFLAEDAIIVVDDYVALFAPEKQALTRPAIDRAVEARELTEWGLLSGVTWIGQRGNRPYGFGLGAAEEKLPLEPASDIRSLSGANGRLNAVRLPKAWRLYADDYTDNHSPLLLFEEGKLLSPAHFPFLLIAKQGGGAYTHWGERLFFSTRDSADPVAMGRTFQMRLGDETRAIQLRLANPHFDHDRILWDDVYSGDYKPVRYEEQFDGQWKLFLEGKEGFVRHTGVETSDVFIDDRIADLTGHGGFLERLKVDPGLRRPAEDGGGRDIGGRLHLDPKFSLDHFRGKRCLDIGCGAGRWTRTLMALGATVKSVDLSEHGLQSTLRFNSDVERLDLFDIIPHRSDLHEAFDFTLCWGVVMCTHDPLLAFENVVKTTRPGGEIYLMVYAPTYHASEYVLTARRRFHRECRTDQEKLDFAYALAGKDRANAINYLDMLNTFYNWTINEVTIQGWCKLFGLNEPIFLNAKEPHKGAHHVLIKKPA